MKYTIKQVKNKFLDYFVENDHKLISGSSIIPENDDSLLFINAGMAPIKNVFTGKEKPESSRMVNMQICIRTNDIDSIGDMHHLSSFCMLGSWSVGDYFKEEAIRLAYNFLINQLEIPKQKLYVSVFGGDESRNIPADADSEGIWQKTGVESNHILKFGFEDNFWRMGDGESPCGPCTEVFFDTVGDEKTAYEVTGEFDDKKRYMEIWNAGVFMQYLQKEDGTYSSLPFNSVDTGSSIERLVMALNGYKSVYETEIYSGIIDYIKQNSQEAQPESLRIISDHLRTSVYMINAGITPSNVKRGYVLRRLLRRTIRHMNKVNFPQELMREIVEKVYNALNDCEVAPVWNLSLAEIISVVLEEQKRFLNLLEKGLQTFKEIISKPENITGGEINTEKIFHLFDTYGFPYEISQDLAKENGLTINQNEFERLFNEHREKSKGDIGKVFKSGLAEVTEKTTAYHTATHLLQAALKKILGEHVSQKGSNITEERMRFDFNFERKVTPEELAEIENFVNKIIEEDVPVICEEMPYEQAKEAGAIGLFADKYGEIVKVYSIGNYSKEMCGGPHVQSTGKLGKFKIQKEESSSSGVRRIKAKLN